MMIESRNDLREYMQRDMAVFRAQSLRERLICKLTCDPLYEISRYVYFLRKEEFFYNTRKGKLGTLFSLFYFRRKNRLGNRLGIKIPRNCFGPGLTIFHHGEIIVNENARIGKDCKLHGGNCIGNDGKCEEVPVIGDRLDLGIGAKIIGGVSLKSDVRVGANAVVTKSFEKSGITLVGIPASCAKAGHKNG